MGENSVNNNENEFVEQLNDSAGLREYYVFKQERIQEKGRFAYYAGTYQAVISLLCFGGLMYFYDGVQKGNINPDDIEKTSEKLSNFMTAFGISGSAFLLGGIVSTFLGKHYDKKIRNLDPREEFSSRGMK